MPNLKLLCFFFCCLFSLSGWGQQIEKEIFLFKEIFDENGNFVHEEIHLTGVPAERFQIHEYLEDYTTIKVLTKINWSVEQGSSLKQIQYITTIDQAGVKKHYHYDGFEWMDEAESVRSRLFIRDDEGQMDRFPLLYVEQKNDETGGDFSLLWSDKGECPGEWREEEFSQQLMKIQLQDENKKTLLLRTLSITEVATPVGLPTKIIEVKVEQLVN